MKCSLFYLILCKTKGSREHQLSSVWPSRYSRVDLFGAYRVASFGSKATTLSRIYGWDVI